MMAIQVPPLIHSKVKIQQCACHTRCETLVTLADVKINESRIECNLQSDVESASGAHSGRSD